MQRVSTATLLICVLSAGVGRAQADIRIVTRADIRSALAEARAIRATERADGTRAATIEIRLPPGTIECSSPVVIDASLSGMPGAPTVIVGHPEGSRWIGARRVPVTLFEAEPITGRQRLDLNLAGVPAPGPIMARGMGRPTAPAPTELFWNGTPLRLASWPDDGFAPIGEVLDAGDTDPDSAHGGSFAPREARVARWADEVDAWVLGYWRWDWADDLLPIAHIEVEERRIELGRGHRYGLHASGRFRVINARAELDQPGEYHLDLANHEIQVLLPALADDDEVLVSTLAEPILLVRGASHVVVRNLELGFTRGAAIDVDGSSQVTVAGCTVRGTGGDGIVLRGRDSRVTRCRIEDVGATGVVLVGGDRATLTPGKLSVEDCEITRFARLARTYRPAVSVTGVGHFVAHNHIHDAPHVAILLDGNEHLIEANDIHDVLLETGDCGAIYMGRDWAMHGIVIRHNLIHDLPGSEHRWQNAIYLDDMASGITVTGNVIWRCNLGMLIGGGRSNSIRDNVFVDCREGLRFDARGIGWMADRIADPKTSILHQRLAQIPFDDPPWSERYPELATTLTNGFGRPIGSEVVDNAFVRTPFGRVDDRDAVRVAGNRELDQPLDPRASATLTVPGLPPIPIGAVGPRR